MEKKVNLKSRFRPQHRKLSLYLSIGVMGICMLAFSAWTPASVKTGAASDSEQHLNSEHIPGTSAGNTADTTPSDSDSTIEQSPENAPGSNEQKVPDSPTGIELYRLVNPWDQQSVVATELEFVEEMPYLEFFITDKGEIIYAPVFKDDGTVVPTTVLDLGFKMSGMTLHMLHPLGQGDTASAAQNAMVMDKVAQFCWYPILNFTGSSFSWWGSTSTAYISFPGGPDLSELLGL